MANSILTAEQAAAISTREGAYLITAPPGTGKTEVLVQRLLRLLADPEGATYRVLALTFTTKAAEEMANRIRQELESQAWRATSCTFHAFALDVLRHYGSPVGVENDVSVVVNTDDRLFLLQQALIREGYAPGASDTDLAEILHLLQTIDLQRRQLVPPDAIDPNDSVSGYPLRDAYFAYEASLRDSRSIDFDGMVRLAHRLLVDFPKIAEHYRDVYEYIMVDEAQDTNLAQYELLKALCGESHRNVFVVADGNQTMYRFAGASTRFLERFETEFGATRLSLTANFRCARTIVEAANCLLGHLSTQTKTPPMIPGGPKGSLVAEALPDQTSEAEALADWCQRLLTDGLPIDSIGDGESSHLNPEDLAVLARSRFAMRSAEEFFSRIEMPFVSHSGDRDFFDSGFHRSVYFGLRMIANPRDLPSKRNFFQEIAHPLTMEELEGGEEPMTLISRLQDSLSPVTKDVIDILSDAQRNSDVSSLLPRLATWLPELEEGTQEKRLQEEERLASDAQTWDEAWTSYRATTQTASMSLQGFLTQLSISRRARLDAPGIRFLTVHASKGLEFKAVAMLGMNEGVFPDFRSDSEGDIDDERRNAYVAMTRAERFLYLTRPKSVLTRYGTTRVQDESRFVAEMGIRMD